jgi:phosphotriesterase-related protein
MSAHLVTTLGDLSADHVGWMLAHEHVFANFYADDDAATAIAPVIDRMEPALQAVKAAGITALVEATAVGGARRPDVLLAVSQAIKLPLIAATGLFKEPAKTEWAHRLGESGLRDWLIRELTEQIDGSTFRAGWIKLSVTDSGVQPHEELLLRAAAHASQTTNAVVGSHTVGAALANAELDIFEAAGGDPARFIWIHTQTEPDVEQHAAFTRRGAWIEYDAIDEDRPDDAYLDWVVRAFDGGYADRVLPSHDRSGYNPTQMNGGTFKPYTYLLTQFVPKLQARGIHEAGIQQLLHANPFRAYAR